MRGGAIYERKSIILEFIAFCGFYIFSKDKIKIEKAKLYMEEIYVKRFMF